MDLENLGAKSQEAFQKVKILNESESRFPRSGPRLPSRAWTIRAVYHTAVSVPPWVSIRDPVSGRT